jgi:hypothetical protein
MNVSNTKPFRVVADARTEAANWRPEERGERRHERGGAPWPHGDRFGDRRPERWPGPGGRRLPSEYDLREAERAVRDLPGVMATRTQYREGRAIMKVFTRDDGDDTRRRIENRAYDYAPGLDDVRISTLRNLVEDVRYTRGVDDVDMRDGRMVVTLRDDDYETERNVRDLIEDKSLGALPYRIETRRDSFRRAVDELRDMTVVRDVQVQGDTIFVLVKKKNGQVVKKVRDTVERYAPRARVEIREDNSGKPDWVDILGAVGQVIDASRR